LIKLFLFFLLLLIIYSPLDKNPLDKKKTRTRNGNGNEACAVAFTVPSLILYVYPFFFPFGSGLSKVFSSPLPRFILSLFSTPLCCIYYPTLLPPPISSVICAPPEIRGFSTLATLVWGSSKTLPSSSPHIQLTHLISLGFFHFHHRVVISSRAFVTSDSELRLTLRVTVNLSIPDNLLHSSSTHPLPVV
jgi:hypothetical protein